MTLRMCEVVEKELRPRKVLPVTEVVTRLRQVKDAQEVAAIRKAIAVAEEAFLSMFRQGKKAFVGRTERQIAADLDYRMRLAGADKPSFDSIVAVGARFAAALSAGGYGRAAGRAGDDRLGRIRRPVCQRLDASGVPG